MKRSLYDWPKFRYLWDRTKPEAKHTGRDFTFNDAQYADQDQQSELDRLIAEQEADDREHRVDKHQPRRRQDDYNGQQ